MMGIGIKAMMISYILVVGYQLYWNGGGGGVGC